MKKLVLAISGFLTLSMMAIFPSMKEDSKVAKAEDLKEKVVDEDWKTYAGLTQNYIANEDETYFSPLDTYGQHGAYTYKVHLDGLTVSCRAEGLPSQSTSFGFYLSKNPNTYLGFPTISVWKGLYGGQTRVNIGEDHNFNKNCFAYSKPDLTSEKRFGLASSMVMQTSESINHAGFKVTFQKYNDDWYSMTFSAVYEDSYIWTNNGVSYNEDTKTCTMYTPVSDLGVLDKKGDCYVNYFGFDTNSKASKFIAYIGIQDDYIRAYQNQYLKEAKTKLQSYIDTMSAVTSVEEFKAALAIRQGYIDSLENLRKHDFYIYSKVKLEEADALVSPIVEKYAAIEVDSKVETAKATADKLLNDETQITSDAIYGFEKNITDAENAYNTYSSFLSETKKSSVLSSLTTFKENKEYFTSLEWVRALEDAIQKLSSSHTLGKDIEEIIQTIDKDGCRENIEALNDEHKTSINTRIENDIASFMQFKKENILSLAGYYLDELSSKAQSGLNSRANLELAIQYLNYIDSKVEFDNQLGETFNRYTSLRKEIIQAADSYIASKITAIDEMYENPIYLLDEFTPIKDAYHDFDFSFFMFEDSTQYAELKDNYEKLTKKVTENPLFYFTSNGVENVEWGKNGIYFDSIGLYPRRLNYNRGLSVKDGLSVTIRSEEMGFYNDGAKANNISINFLNEDNLYKGESNGLNIVFWLYKATTIVRIYNKVDGEIASVIINTPTEVTGDYVLTFEAFDDNGVPSYRLKVNEGEIVVSKQMLEDCGVVLNDMVYFSMGSFMDDNTFVNNFSISEICGVDFKLPKEVIDRNDNKGTEPEPNPNPGTSTSNTPSSIDSNSSSSQGNSSKGCSGSISASTIALCIGLLGVAISKKKKEDKASC